LRQRGRWASRHAPLDLGEAGAAREQLADDEDRPSLAEHVGRLGDRAELAVGRRHEATVPLQEMKCRMTRAGRRITGVGPARDGAAPQMTSSTKAAISLTTGLEDPEKVTVAFLVAVGAAE